MRFRTLGLVGGSGGLAGALGFAGAFVSAAGLAAILVGAAGFAVALGAEAAVFFCGVSSLRVAFNAVLTAAGLELVADFAAAGFSVFGLAVLLLTAALVEPFVKPVLATAGLLVFVFSTGLFSFGLANGLTGFPFDGLVSDLDFLATGFDELAFAGLAITAFADLVDLPLVPCF